MYCAHCRRDFPRSEFVIKRRERRLMWNGARVVSATHQRCRRETEWPEQLTEGRILAGS